jgi:hypothetical protein
MQQIRSSNKIYNKICRYTKPFAKYAKHVFQKQYAEYAPPTLLIDVTSYRDSGY